MVCTEILHEATERLHPSCVEPIVFCKVQNCRCFQGLNFLREAVIGHFRHVQFLPRKIRATKDNPGIYSTIQGHKFDSTVDCTGHDITRLGGLKIPEMQAARSAKGSTGKLLFIADHHFPKWLWQWRRSAS